MKIFLLNLSLSGNKYSTTVPKLKERQKFFFLSFFLFGFSAAMAQTPQMTGKTAVWTGAISNDWCTAGNWQSGIVPDETTSTLIPAKSKNMPVVCDGFSFNAYTNNIDVQDGATLTVAVNKTLNVFGNFTNTNPSVYVLAGRINFAGADQFIPGFAFTSVSINGGGTKTLTGNATVSSILVLTRGIVKTSATSLITLGYRSMISAGYESSYIDGPLTRLTNSTHTYSFPIGAAGRVKSVNISPNDETAGSYTVAYHNTVTPNNGVFACTNLMADKNDEYWDVTRTSGSANAYLQVEYKAPASEQSWSNRQLPLEGSSVAMIVNNSGAWKYSADAAMGVQNLETIAGEYDGQVGGQFEYDAAKIGFGYGYNTIDSINLLSFAAALNGYNASVNWNLKQGNDLVITDLEHSTDNKNFERLTTVQSGNAIPNAYAHNNLRSGVHYYRLHLKDKAGNISVSKTIQVVIPEYVTRIDGLKATQVRYDGYVKIQSAANQQVSICLFDMAGHQVSKISGGLQPGDNSIHFNTMMITPGIYNLYVQTADGARATLRFMKD